MNTDFSKNKKYLLILDYYENGKTDVEWYENFDDAKKRASEEIDAIHYGIYHVKDISLVEESQKEY